MTDWNEQTYLETYRDVRRAGLNAATPEVGALLHALADRYREVLETFSPGSAAGIATAGSNVNGWTEAVVLARKINRTPSLQHKPKRTLADPV